GEVLVRSEPSGLLPLQPSPRPETFTAPQLDILRLLAKAKSNKEIGLARDISHYTAPIPVWALVRALDVPSRPADAVKYRALLGQGDAE
ncbi:DNA-binding response regulator, partial [Pseudomonas aeruginosa]